jgi:hypothetical protein
MAQKVVIDSPLVETPVLPPLKDVMTWFGLPATPAEAVREMARREGVAPPADSKTLRKLTSSDGISTRKASEIESFIARVSPEIEALSEAVSDCKYYKLSNGWQWDMCMRSFAEERLLAPGHAAGFVRERIKSEQRLIKRAREAITNGGSNEDIARVISDSLDYKCSVPRTVVERGVGSWVFLLSDRRDTESQAALLRWLHYGRIDFYYRLLCEFSLDLIVVMKEAQNFSEVKDRMVLEGAFSRIAPQGRNASDWQPFEALMDGWRSQLGDGKPLSWRRLASYMPTPKRRMAEITEPKREKDQAAADFETQWRRLHEWRNGTVPQDNQLRAFVTNILPEGYDVRLSLLMAKISLAWSAFIRQEVELANSHSALKPKEHNALLASFPGYWDKYRDQAAELAA